MLNLESINYLAALAIRSLQEANNSDVSTVRHQGFCTPEHDGKFEIRAWRSNGFSDSEIYRLSAGFGEFAIRSWPKSVETPLKITFWLGVNNVFCNQDGDLKSIDASIASPFPRIYRWCDLGERNAQLFPYEDRLWTLCDWVQGQPILRGDVPKELICHLATVLGRLHANTLIAKDDSGDRFEAQIMQSSSVSERLAAVKSLDHRVFSTIDEISFFRTCSLVDRVKHSLAIVMERKSAWQNFLSISSRQMRTCHWIVRDLWRENVLIDDQQRFTSIVDLGAARFDWPGLDFTRLFGSLSHASRNTLISDGNPNEDLWQEAYSAYTQENPAHGIDSLDECRMLHLVSSGLAIAQWVRWIKEGTFDFRNEGKSLRVANRVAELCDQFLIESQ